MKQLLTLLTACLLLFVVVCPITPTPIAVPGGKAQAAQSPVVAVAIAALPGPVRSERTAWSALSFEVPSASAVDVVDRTCARLC